MGRGGGGDGPVVHAESFYPETVPALCLSDRDPVADPDGVVHNGIVILEACVLRSVGRIYEAAGTTDAVLLRRDPTPAATVVGARRGLAEISLRHEQYEEAARAALAAGRGVLVDARWDPDAVQLLDGTEALLGPDDRPPGPASPPPSARQFNGSPGGEDHDGGAVERAP